MQNLPKILRISVFTFLSIVLFYSCEHDTPEIVAEFPANKVKSVFIDKSDVVWAGTDIGIISFWKNKWTSFENLNIGEVNDISQLASGSNSYLWLTTESGAQFAEYKLNSIISTNLYTKDMSGILDNRVSAVLCDSISTSWFATPMGISVFKDNLWYSRTDFGDLEIYPVISLAEGSNGWIFAGTKGLGVGRFKYDSGVDGISGASYYNTEWTSLPSDTILCIYVDEKNQQWFGTPNGVAFHAAWETKKGWKVYSVSDGLINNRVQSIIGDRNGHMWFGTAEGVSYFDGKTWKNYTITDGLVDPSVNDIAIDTDGNIWFATNRGISSFDGSKWKNFSKR